MSSVKMAWYGGPNYSTPGPDDFESFPSLAAAVREFAHRALDRDPYYPCVEDSEGLIYFGEIPTDEDPYPGLVLTVGPRGGIRRSVA